MAWLADTAKGNIDEISMAVNRNNMIFFTTTSTSFLDAGSCHGFDDTRLGNDKYRQW